MANTNTKKSTAKKVAETKTAEESKKAPVQEKIASDELIACRSVCYGELLLPGKKSDMLYIWGNYGDISEVEFQDLRTLRSTKSRYLYDPKFVIEDERVRAMWPELEEVFQRVTAVDIDRLFELPVNQFKAKIKQLPEGYHSSLRNMASAKILSGELDSIAKIKALDELMGSELMLYIQ